MPVNPLAGSKIKPIQSELDFQKRTVQALRALYALASFRNSPEIDAEFREHLAALDAHAFRVEYQNLPDPADGPLLITEK